MGQALECFPALHFHADTFLPLVEPPPFFVPSLFLIQRAEA